MKFQKTEWKDGLCSSGDFALDDAELKGLFNDKTKMIIINTPNNPIGKVYNRYCIVIIILLHNSYCSL